MDEMGKRIPVIAKIEKPPRPRRWKRLSRPFDGIMVARGDLGKVEMPLEAVPLVQKRDRAKGARKRTKTRCA